MAASQRKPHRISSVGLASLASLATVAHSPATMRGFHLTHRSHLASSRCRSYERRDSDIQVSDNERAFTCHYKTTTRPSSAAGSPSSGVNPWNPGVVDDLAAPDICFEYSLHQPLRGRAAVKEFATNFRAAFPDINFWGTAELIARRRLCRRTVGGRRNPTPASRSTTFPSDRPLGDLALRSCWKMGCRKAEKNQDCSHNYM